MKQLFLLLLLVSVSSSAETLRDARGRTIGTTSTTTSGIIIIRDSRGRTTGMFDPKQNVTRDARGRTFGSGNQLSSTLSPPKK